MKFLIVYSSRTGNTRQVAEALYAAAPDGSTISNVETAPAADDYDVIFVGYWMDRGTADEKSKAYEQQFIKYLAHDEDKEEKLFEHPELFKTPIVRNGKQATVGYCPEIWKDWE